MVSFSKVTQVRKPMPDRFHPDEALKNEAISQAMEGDFIGARQTGAKIAARQDFLEAWMYILHLQRDRGDVIGIKETILSCPNPSWLQGHSYAELARHFAKIGNKTAAIEIAKLLGRSGEMMVVYLSAPVDLILKGDFAGAREAVAKVEDEQLRNQLNALVDREEQIRSGPTQQSVL